MVSASVNSWLQAGCVTGVTACDNVDTKPGHYYQVRYKLLSLALGKYLACPMSAYLDCCQGICQQTVQFFKQPMTEISKAMSSQL